MDEQKIKQAVALFLEGIGEDPQREGLRDTPDRVARMCAELFGGRTQTAAAHLQKTFTTKNTGMVIEKNIGFYSVCEHHIVPFFGAAHIAYIPAGRVAGLSKLARTVEVFARRLQIQENLTFEIASAIMETVQPRGVMVVVEAEHLCMSMRGVTKEGARTTTTAALGCFETDRALQELFLSAI